MIHKIFRALVLGLIKFYQLSISPLLGSHCRHTPTCSVYTTQAIKEWGLINGIKIGFKRIIRCHPWGTSGHDPVPKREGNQTQQV